MSHAGDQVHWDRRYAEIGSQSVSWYEECPTTSLELLDAVGIRVTDALVDVGGGASMLVDHLLARGHTDVTVLDLSEVALATARTRLGDPPQVTWITHDLLTWGPNRRRAVWHDRAVLHFLVDEQARTTYVAVMRGALERNGAFVIGVFAEDGPTECSALPVRRYRPEELAELLGDVEVVEQRHQVHRTPGGAEQPFNWIAGRLRRDAAT